MNKKRLFVLVSIIAILAMAIPAFAQGTSSQLAQPAQTKTSSEVYIVQMIDSPAVAYEGGIAGYKATQPAAGKKIDPYDPNVVKYVGYLKDKHDQALNAVGAKGNKLYDYVFSLNGFAARLTPAQVEAVKKQAEVVFVWKDELRQATTDNSPEFLGLTEEGGLWDMGIKGEDVIIGVIDTGIWPEHPSFSDRTGTNPNGKPGKLDYQQVPGWHGKCVPGEMFNASNCNQKLIGAQYFYAAWGKDGITNDYLSTRDHDGHGTHTASTAGGNANIHATILGTEFGTISGIAPRARIAAYKALWNDLGGYTSDLAAAIDQAVADGVDVINYSIGSSGTSIGPDDISFLFAARAGIYVATSAGNAGPDPSTIGAPATVPWVTTVGASTQDRSYIGSVVLGDGSEYFGTTITQGTGDLPIVDAEDAGDELCGPDALDEDLVSGNIVLCKRGKYNRADKSLAVYMAGGAGMVLYNANDEQSKDTDNHWVPSVHINNTDGLAVKAYIDAEGDDATAHINHGVRTDTPAPWMTDFSSRGPNGQSFDILKPDITAPGLNILAGNSPNPYLGAPGQLFQMIGGTSMSSPHVAGVFALLKQAHPTWSAAMAKSALMTTAYQSVMKQDGVTPADPFDFGAGHLNPNPSVDPGLVYNAGWNDYLAYLCAIDPSVFANPAVTCGNLAAAGYSLDPSNVNLPSLAIGALAGTETLTRKVTSVTPGNTDYHVTVEAPAGLTVTVDPEDLNLNFAQTKSFNVTFEVADVGLLNSWVFGSLTWSDGSHDARSPFAVRPVALAAPVEVFGSGEAGSLEYDVAFGYDGTFATENHGLEPAALQTGTVIDDPENDFDTAYDTCDFDSVFPYECTGITWHEVLIPAGTVHARFSLFDDYVDGETDDLDLYVYFDDGTNPGVEVGSSGSGTSAEQVDLSDPDPGTYRVAVHGWQTDGPDANYTLFSWAVGPDNSNFTVTAPAAAVLGTSETVTIDWTGLTPDTKYLGAVSYSDGVNPLGLTLIDVNVPPAP
jgi:subtilisin family serine protease